MPVERITGTPTAAALRISGRSTISKDAIFIAGTPTAARLSTASWSNGVEKNAIRARAGVLGELRLPLARKRDRFEQLRRAPVVVEVLEARRLRRVEPAPVYVWNFTASAPASAATSISSLARPRSRLWLAPASAITYTGSADGRSRRPPMAKERSNPGFEGALTRPGGRRA